LSSTLIVLDKNTDLLWNPSIAIIYSTVRATRVTNTLAYFWLAYGETDSCETCDNDFFFQNLFHFVHLILEPLRCATTEYFINRKRILSFKELKHGQSVSGKKSYVKLLWIIINYKERTIWQLLSRIKASAFGPW
jgi:hypothetical protein